MFTTGQLHLICNLFIVLLLYSNKICGKGIISFIGNVQNLTVQAVVDERYSKDNDTYNTIKLNISWLPPNSDRQPTSYSIIITNIPKENIKNTDVECPDESLYYTTKDGNELSALLPQTHFLSDMPEMHVRPKCCYKIEVFANPRMKATHKSEVNYTVPECISGRCSCANAKLVLPVPEISVIQHSQTIFVKWNITSDDSHVDSYAISIGAPLLTSKAGLLVYNTTRIGITPAQKINFTWNLKNLDKFITLKSGYKILVTAIDHHGCLGMEGEYLINIPEFHASLKDANNWLMIFGIFGLFITFGIFTFTWFFRGKKCKFISKSTSNTRTIKASAIVKCKSQWAASVLQKQNVLYVEQVTEDTVYKDGNDDFEVSYKSVQLIHELGKGQFGRVYLGRLNKDAEALVAVKMTQCFEMFNASEAQQQFIEEINIMKAAGPHPHLVRLIGYCTKPDKPMCIILEYMEGGNLLAYLHSIKHNYGNESTARTKRSLSQESGHSTSETLYTTISSRLSSMSAYTISTKFSVQYTGDTNIQENEQFPLKYVNISECCEIDKNGNPGKIYFSKISREQFMKFALDIAKGMKHLEAKGIIHRDLAARNILLSSDLTLKIADFGLSRNGVYIINNLKSKTRHLPIRWMSLEALRDRAFSSKSDVWSFAIVLWEIGTLGSFPYSNIRDDQLLWHIINNKSRLEKPDGVSSNVYEIMKLCWSPEPVDRPSFTELVSILQNLQESSDNATSNPCYTLLS